MLEGVIDAVLLNGTVGAGKSTTASALSDRLWGAEVPHALVDLDDIRLLRPPPPGDPFQFEVMTRNLHDLARNFRAAGAVRLVVAGVVETQADLERLREAVTPWRLLAVRLTVSPEDAIGRLRDRHADDAEGLSWHLDRSPRLAALLEQAQHEDAVIATTGRTAAESAVAVAAAAGW